MYALFCKWRNFMSFFPIFNSSPFLTCLEFLCTVWSSLDSDHLFSATQTPNRHPIFPSPIWMYKNRKVVYKLCVSLKSYSTNRIFSASVYLRAASTRVPFYLRFPEYFGVYTFQIIECFPGSGSKYHFYRFSCNCFVFSGIQIPL